ASLDAAAGEPGGEDLVMMLAAGVGGLLVVGGAAELGGPDDERFVEETTLLQVGDQGGDRLVDVFGQAHVVLHVAVRVPVAGGSLRWCWLAAAMRASSSFCSSSVGERRATLAMGTGPGTMCVPWWQPGRKSQPQVCVPAYGGRGAMTMNDGRLRFSVPRP